MTEEEAYSTALAMRIFGGHFVKSLAMAWTYADYHNRNRLYAAFPDYFKEYGPGSDPYKAVTQGATRASNVPDAGGSSNCGDDRRTTESADSAANDT
jgi:hypothetical protein